MKNKKTKPDISFVLNELNKPSENPIVKEILKIDTRSFNMAQLVNQNAEERVKLKQEAIELMNRLDSLAEKLDEKNPEEYSKVTDQISESQLDLMYVEMENDMISLRLGNYLKDTDEEIQSLKQTQDITKIKLAINNFLNHSGRTDLLERENSIEPIKKFDEVSGSFWEIRNPNANIRVSTGDPPKVIWFSSYSDIPKRVDNQKSGKVFTETDALQKAIDLAISQVPDFKNRNFVLSTDHKKELYSFKWREQPAGKILSVSPNWIKVRLERESLKLYFYSVFNFPSWRIEPPQISKKQAGEIAEKVWEGKVEEFRLWQRIRNGGKSVRTVWTVTLFFNNPEGGSVEDVVIDADTGEILEGKRY